MTVDSQTRAYQQATMQVAAAATAYGLTTWQQAIDAANLLVSFNEWLLDLEPFVDRATTTAVELARADYATTRRVEGVTASYRFQPRPLNREAFRRSMFGTAGQALQGIERFEIMPDGTARGVDPGAALKRAQILAAGVTTRYVMNGARNSTIATVKEDREAIGAVYVTRGDAKVCYWCAMLASRGPVYKEHSFEASDALFEGEGTAKSHDHCRCVLKNVYRTDTALLDEARALRDEWRDVNWKEGWREMDPRVPHIKNSGKKALRAWRAHWEKSR